MAKKLKKITVGNETYNLSGDYADLSNKPLSVVNGEVKYTLSDGTTQLTLAQKSELATVATSGSYNDLTNTPTIPQITFRTWSTE